MPGCASFAAPLSRELGVRIPGSQALSSSGRPLRSAPACPPRARARWVCETKAHPWGNGGLENVANFDGYDREETKAEFARLKVEFEKSIPELEAQLNSMWAIIFNTDIIQWDNNLMNAAMEFGLELELNDARVVHVSERVASTMFDGHIEEMYALRRSDGDETDDEEEFVSAKEGQSKGLLILFQTDDDASRFASNLSAEDRGNVVPAVLSMSRIRSICVERGMMIGFVAPSFVQPSHFADGAVL